jgi:hypothetical protein
MQSKIALGLALALGMSTAACRQRGESEGATGEDTGSLTERRGGSTTGGEQKLTETGTVANASEDKITLRRPTGDELELDVRPETSIMRGGQKVDATALSEGAEVRASYVIRGDEKVAERIEVMGAGQQGEEDMPDATRRGPAGSTGDMQPQGSGSAPGSR